MTISRQFTAWDFVPEGQDDRSRLRSAWKCTKEMARPSGTVEMLIQLFRLISA
jgi:hypothetical protein